MHTNLIPNSRKDQWSRYSVDDHRHHLRADDAPGLSFLYGGMVDAKNVISTMLQSFIAMGVITVMWVAFGFCLCFGNDIGGVIGTLPPS